MDHREGGVERNRHLEELSAAELRAWRDTLGRAYEDYRARGLELDITRGKPSLAQLELSAALDGILEGDYRLADGTDTRGYGGPFQWPQAAVEISGLRRGTGQVQNQSRQRRTRPKEGPTVRDHHRAGMPA